MIPPSWSRIAIRASWTGPATYLPVGGQGALGDGASGVHHTVEVAGAPGGLPLLARSPEGDLGDREADHDEQNRGLHVVGAGDGEAEVGHGEEEI